jgi:hypothetical protein
VSSFFDQRDPTLSELIAYVIDRALDRDTALTKTKLVKLLYLVDVETWRLERQLLTKLDWRFYHYGPYAFELEPVLDQLEGQQVEWKEFTPGQLERTILYTRVWQSPSSDQWPAMTKMRVDKIVDRWADETLELLLDYVYFETEPMQHARRGEYLDFNTVERRSTEPWIEPARVNDVVRERLREVVAAARARRDALDETPNPRFDEVWEQAMERERAADEAADLEGATFVFSDDAAASFGSATDE